MLGAFVAFLAWEAVLLFETAATLADHTFPEALLWMARIGEHVSAAFLPSLGIQHQEIADTYAVAQEAILILSPHSASYVEVLVG